MESSSQSPKVEKYSIGIDLGTTNSCCAIIKEGSKDVQVVTDGRGDRIVPSIVQFLSQSIITGSAAAAIQDIVPDSIVYDVKRIMDVDHDDAIRLREKSQWPFTLQKESIVVDNAICDFTTIGVNVGGTQQRLLPQEVSAHILFTLKSMAEKFVGPTALITKAVICVPANYTIPQKEATKVAALIAGFQKNDLIIMNEPTAAALAYGLHRQEGRRNVLIYDLGGGTFDVTVLTVFNGMFDVRATGGSGELGGRDFDINMRNEFVEALNQKQSGIQLTPKKLQKLLLLCEEAKKNLLVREAVDIILKGILPEKANFTHTFTRETFNEINEPLFQQTMRILKETIEDSKVDEIHDIVLVGGSTRIPRIVELITSYFKMPPVAAGEVNPDEAVAIGAALNAALTGGVCHRNFEAMTFLDVAPNHFGIATQDQKFSVIIFKDTPLPHVSPAVKYENSKDDQKALSIDIYEGLDVEVAKHNRLICSFIVDGLPKGKARTIYLTVTFEMDQSGFLKVTVVILSNGKTEVRQIESKKKIPPSLLELLQRKFRENCNGEWTTTITRKRKRDFSSSGIDVHVGEADDAETEEEELVF